MSPRFARSGRDSMEDWETRLADLDARLREWNRRFEAELEHICKERKLRGWLRKARREDLQSAAEEARRRAGTEILAELSTFLDGLCDRYLESLPQERAKIRARVGAAEGIFDLFWGYVEQAPARIRGPQDGPELLRGFISVAIDDMRAELSLVDAVLGRLIVAAAAVGLDWKPHLARAALVSNPGAGGGGTCMREHLEGFERSGHFRNEVAPRLREASRKTVLAPARG